MGEMQLASSCARAKAEPAMSPLAEFAQLLSRGRHFGENFFGVREQPFTGLGENHSFAHPVQKPTTTSCSSAFIEWLIADWERRNSRGSA